MANLVFGLNQSLDHAMSLIRNRYAVFTRARFLGLLLSALLALALFDYGAATAQEVVKQIKLTDKHIQNFMAAYEDIAKVYDGAESDKPEDPKVEAQAAAVAKKNGFASLAQYDDVLTNITMIMFGIDPQTKKFTEPSEQIKNEIAALKADKSVPGRKRKTAWRSSRRRSRTQSQFSSRKTSRWC